jgi:hypothetical protein
VSHPKSRLRALPPETPGTRAPNRRIVAMNRSGILAAGGGGASSSATERRPAAGFGRPVASPHPFPAQAATGLFVGPKPPGRRRSGRPTRRAIATPRFIEISLVFWT